MSDLSSSDEMDVEINDEIETVIIDKTKKSVIFNSKLDNYSTSLVHYINEYPIDEDVDIYNKIHICNIKSNDDYVYLKWKLRKHMLNKIKFINNLESLIDYEKGVNAPLTCIFALIECIRLYYNKDIVIFKHIDDEYTSIYI